MSEIPDPPKTTGSIPRRSPQDEHPRRNRAVSMSSKKPATSSTPAMAPDHSSQQPKPGSCALRLENLEQQTSAEKRELMVSIAADICATFISIAKYSEDGTLQAQHTGVVDNVIQTIRGTDVKQRNLLDRKLRRLHKERNWIRKKYSRLVGQADALGRAYQTKMRKLRISLREAQAEVARLQNERDILRAWLKKNVIEEGASDGDVDGEFEVDEGEDVDGEYETVESGDGN